MVYRSQTHSYLFIQRRLWLSIRLILINKSWVTGELPITWKESTITPLLKPNEDPQEPTSYRPISLTSAICKTMETMVNNRLLKKK